MKSNQTDITGNIHTWTLLEEKFMHPDSILKSWLANILHSINEMIVAGMREIRSDWNTLKSFFKSQEIPWKKQLSRLFGISSGDQMHTDDNPEVHSKLLPFKTICEGLENISLGIVEQVQHLQYLQIDLQRKSELIMQQDQEFLKSEKLEKYFETEEDIAGTIKQMGKIIDAMVKIERCYWKQLHGMETFKNPSPGNSKTYTDLADAGFLVIESGQFIMDSSSQILVEVKKSISRHSLTLLKNFNKNISDQTSIILQSSQQIEMLGSLILLEQEFSLSTSV